MENIIWNEKVKRSISPQITSDEGGIFICSGSSEYIHTELVSSVEDVKENGEYGFEAETESCGIKVKFACRWYDEGGKELLGQMLFNGLRCYSPEGAVKAVLSAVVWGKGSLRITRSSFEYIGERKKRLVTLAAIANDRGFEFEHPLRHCEDNLKESLVLIDKTVKQHKPDIILMTEHFYSRFISADPEEIVFLKENSPQIQSLKDKAKEYGIYLAFSFKEIDDKGYKYNTALLIDRRGNTLGKYRKTHLTIGELSGGIIPGDEIGVFDTDFGKVGIAICWDIFFPEYIRALQLKGAEIILNPTAGYDEIRNITRCQDNGMCLVVSGSRRKTTAIYNAEGEILDDACNTGAACAVIDLNERVPVKYLSFDSASFRRETYFADRRPDLYGDLTK